MNVFHQLHITIQQRRSIYEIVSPNKMKIKMKRVPQRCEGS